MDVGKFAKFSMKTNSVPQDFGASKEIEDLINLPVEAYNFDKELLLIGKYEDLKTKKSTKQPADNFDLMSFDASPIVDPAAEAAAILEQQKAENEVKTNEMMSETNADRDTCTFYLESTDWDIKAAVLLHSLV